MICESAKNLCRSELGAMSPKMPGMCSELYVKKAITVQYYEIKIWKILINKHVTEICRHNLRQFSCERVLQQQMLDLQEAFRRSCDAMAWQNRQQMNKR